MTQKNMTIVVVIKPTPGVGSIVYTIPDCSSDHFSYLQKMINEARANNELVQLYADGPEHGPESNVTMIYNGEKNQNGFPVVAVAAEEILAISMEEQD